MLFAFDGVTIGEKWTKTSKIDVDFFYSASKKAERFGSAFRREWMNVAPIASLASFNVQPQSWSQDPGP